MGGGFSFRLTAAVVVVAACAEPRHVSDTGFVGTWWRGNERASSSMAILADGERYLWRGQVDTIDAKLEVRCPWDGECVEHVEGHETSRFTCTLEREPQHEQALLLECRGRVLQPEPRELHYRKRLELSQAGLVLISTMLEQDGREPQGQPRLDFAKIDDRVLDPPPGR